MPAIINERFITQMKLQELQRQRRDLLAMYATLEQDLAKAASPAEQVTLMYERLRNLTFAEHLLHPTVRQLDVLIQKVRAGLASAAILTFWHERLQQELATGRRRTNSMYLFGALLEETFATTPETSDETPEQQKMHQEALTAMQQPAPHGDYRALIDLFVGPQPLFASQTPITDRQLLDGDVEVSYTADGIEMISLDHGVTHFPREQVMTPTFSSLYRRITTKELQEVLEIVRLDRYRSIDTRSQAAQILASPLLLHELGDALTIQIQHLDDWQWPQDGIETTLQWQRTRYRLYVDEDLPTNCLFEILGRRWQALFKEQLASNLSQRLGELRRLEDHTTADESITIALDRLKSSLNPFLRYHRDIWSTAQSPASTTTPREQLRQALMDFGETSSVRVQRAREHENLHAFDLRANYHDMQGVAGITPMLTFTNAELVLAQTRFPERPIYVAKADIQQFYASLSHEVILELLRSLGLAEHELAFFGRYLAIPIREGEQVFECQRGVLLNRHLADLLAELVLRVVDMYIQAQANVQVIRMVDDITLIAADPAELTRAWAALQDGLARLGLQLNEAKCGAVAVNGEIPAGLPIKEPSWMMVTMAADGEWHVDSAQVDAFRAMTARLVQQAPSVMGSVTVYNHHITYLEQALMADTWLGLRYQQAMFATLIDFHENLFGNGQGILSTLAERLHQRVDNAVLDIPEAWYYWPLTAGGLAIHEPAILAGSYRDLGIARDAQTVPTAMTRDWQHQYNEWSNFYPRLIQAAQQSEPQLDQVMETLINDFIQRGKDLTNGKQSGLSAYWRWILSSYGPQLLAAFGSFRFLLSELVPLQLISNRIEFLTDDPDIL